MNTASIQLHKQPKSWAKRHVLISYSLMVIGLFTAIPMVLGAVWAFVKRKNYVGTVFHSHYSNAVRVFWWSVVWTIVGAILSSIVIGYAILAIAWLWALYRLVNGMAKAIEDQPYSA